VDTYPVSAAAGVCLRISKAEQAWRNKTAALVNNIDSRLVLIVPGELRTMGNAAFHLWIRKQLDPDQKAG
jgi:hypothetical protein